jgi:CRISPR/Cas system CSM-associated protein Csm2 small subunit
MLLLSNTAFAQTLQLNNDEITKIKTEINQGKPVQDVLRSHNIDMNKIRSTLAETELAKGNHKITNTQISNIAKKLGIDASDIQTEITAGKSLNQIFQAHNITQDQIRTVLAEQQTDNHTVKKVRSKK